MPSYIYILCMFVECQTGALYSPATYLSQVQIYFTWIFHRHYEC